MRNRVRKKHSKCTCGATSHIQFVNRFIFVMHRNNGDISETNLRFLCKMAVFGTKTQATYLELLVSG